MFTFQKKERLCHQKTIQLLFNREVSKFFVYPLKVSYIKTCLGADSPIQVLIVVSKKYHPHAVKRNYIKRMIREAYRKNKHILYEVLQNQQIQIALMINYTEHEVLPYKKIESKIISTLNRLCELYEKNNS
ncbi:MAG: ribonuclease P protein component [Bacteroidota bacterium]